MQSKFVLVTGSSSGLGREMSMQLSRDGYTVLAGVRNREDQLKVAADIPRSVPILLDLVQPGTWDDAVEKIAKICGDHGLAALVNNAGFSNFAPIEFTDEAEARAVFEVNFFAPFRLTQRLLPVLRRFGNSKAGRPKVVNIVSWAAIMPGPWNAFYYASKAALLALTEAQFYEFRQIGVDSIAILPGMMRTAFMEKSGKELERGIANLPWSGELVYGKSMRHIHKIAKSSASNPIVSDPRGVAVKVAEIVKRSRPKFRYLLGLDTKVVDFIVRLPFGVRYAMNRSVFQLSR